MFEGGLLTRRIFREHVPKLAVLDMFFEGGAGFVFQGGLLAQGISRKHSPRLAVSGMFAEGGAEEVVFLCIILVTPSARSTLYFGGSP